MCTHIYVCICVYIYIYICLFIPYHIILYHGIPYHSIRHGRRDAGRLVLPLQGGEELLARLKW